MGGGVLTCPIIYTDNIYAFEKNETNRGGWEGGVLTCPIIFTDNMYAFEKSETNRGGLGGGRYWRAGVVNRIQCSLPCGIKKARSRWRMVDISMLRFCTF